jgi:16S rRNA (uracil1498-N3)-methyltransferase
LPDIATAPDLETAATGDWLTLLVATKGRDPAPLREAASGNALALAVGPEGDFTRDELDLLLEKGGKPISLGASTFRSEVAAALAAALIRYEMGLLGP